MISTNSEEQTPETKKEDTNQEVELLSEEYTQYDLSFKIISIQATKQIFEKNYIATVGFEFFTFNIRIKGKVLKLQIWDTCGQEIYRSLVTNFYRNSSLAVIVYAINE